MPSSFLLGVGRAVPQVDDLFVLDDEGGWNERVKTVWWAAAGATVELGRVEDSQEEGLAVLLDRLGWRRL